MLLHLGGSTSKLQATVENRVILLRTTFFYQGMMLHIDAGASYLLGYKDLAFRIKLLLRASSSDGLFWDFILLSLYSLSIKSNFRKNVSFTQHVLIGGGGVCVGRGWSQNDISSFATKIATDLRWRNSVPNTCGIPENIPFQFGEDHMMYTSKYNDMSLRAFPNGKTHRTPPPYSHSAHQEK